MPTTEKFLIAKKLLLPNQDVLRQILLTYHGKFLLPFAAFSVKEKG